jgi:hypothetical protein
VWRDGALTVLPLPGGARSSLAHRINRAGDVLLKVYGGGDGPIRTRAAVHRADGSVFWMGPLRYSAPATLTPLAGSATTCCDAGDLTDEGQALGTVGTRVFGVAARYDVATGQLVDSFPQPYTLLNGRGQMVGAIQGGSVNYASTVAFALGFTLPPLPPARRRASATRPDAGRRPSSPSTTRRTCSRTTAATSRI